MSVSQLLVIGCAISSVVVNLIQFVHGLELGLGQ